MMNSIYNSFDSMPLIPYNIIAYLAQNSQAENFWKLLYYPTYDCLSKPNLTLSQKISMIWKNQDRQEDYNIYLTYLVGNMQLDAKTILKIYQYDNNPINKNIAVSAYEFDILYGQKIAMVEYNGAPCNRAEVLEMELLKSLNGQVVSNAGKFVFDSDMSRLCRARFNIGNNSTFTGISLIFATQVANNYDTGC